MFEPGWQDLRGQGPGETAQPDVVEERKYLEDWKQQPAGNVWKTVGLLSSLARGEIPV